MPYKKFAKDMLFVEIAHVIKAAKTLVFIPIIVKILGPEAYGVWLQLNISISLISIIATLGQPYTIVRFLRREIGKEQIKEAIYSTLCLIFATTSLLGIVLIKLAKPVSRFFGSDDANLVKILAFAVLFECLNLILLGVFRAFQQMGRYSLFTILQTAGEIGLVSAMILSGRGLIMAVMSLLIIKLFIFLLMLACILKEVGIAIPNFSNTKEYLHFGLPLIPADLSSWIIQSSDKFLLSYFLGVIYVGYYGAAHSLSDAILLLIFPFSFTLPAVLSKLYAENDILKIRKMLEYSLKYLLLIIIPATFGLSVIAKPLLAILTTKEIAMYSFFVVPIIALGFIMRGGQAIYLQSIVLKKKTQIIGAVSIIAGLLNIVLNFFLIPILGITGAAIATLIGHTFSFVIIFYYSGKEIRFNVDWYFILKSTIASILMSLCIVWLNPKEFSHILLSIVLSVVLYVLFIFFLRAITKKEFHFFVELLGF